MNAKEIYDILSNMALISYTEQKSRLFQGNLKHYETNLTIEQANELYNNDLTQKKPVTHIGETNNKSNQTKKDEVL